MQNAWRYYPLSSLKLIQHKKMYIPEKNKKTKKTYNLLKPPAL